MTEADPILFELMEMREELRELLRAERARESWAAWTPQLYQNGNRTSTITYARYLLHGKLVVVQVKLVGSEIGSAANAVTVTSIPTAIAPARTGALATCGSGIINRTGVTAYAGTLVALSATDFVMLTGTNTDYVGAAPSFALAVGDTITLLAVYEIA